MQASSVAVAPWHLGGRRWAMLGGGRDRCPSGRGETNLHNPDYHELKNAEGESPGLIDKAKSVFCEVWMKL